MRIGSTHTFVATVLPSVVRRLRGEYPLISLKIQDGNLLKIEDRLRSGKLDFFVSYSAIYTAISSLGSAYAPAVSKNLFTTWGFSKAYMAAAGFSLFCLIFSALFMDNRHWRRQQQPVPADTAPQKGLRHLFRGLSLKVVPICTIGLFANITKDMNSFYAVQLGLDKGIDVTIGIAIAGTLAVAIGIAVGLLIDRGHVKKIMYLSLALLSASCFIYGYARTTSMATVAAIIYRLGLGGYWPALIALCCYALPGKQGAAIATLYFFLDVVSLANNTLLGGLYDWVGISGMYLAVGCMNVFAIVYYFFVQKIPLFRKSIKPER